jgi:Flp pilus assembly protein TadD
MWLLASTNMAGQTNPSAAAGGCGEGARVRGGRLLACSLAAAVLLAGCSLTYPVKPTESGSQPVGSDTGAAAGAAGGAGGTGASGTPKGVASASGTAPNAPAVPVTARGKADFDRAVGLMRAGKNTEAELEFKQVGLQFPQLASPYINLGILYRKGGHLEQSEDALKTAVEREDGSALAWTELGATQRMRGEFPNAAASYEKAIAADPNFAPAYRNLGVVSDLYLGDPERALTAFERYKELTGEEKPVSGWIAELRQRTGKPPLRKAPAAQAPAQESNGAQKPADAPPAAAPPPKTEG